MPSDADPSRLGAVPPEPVPPPPAPVPSSMPARAVHRSGRGGVPVLGIDVGSTNVKAVLVLVDAAAGRVTEVAVRSTRTPDDPHGLLRAVGDVVAAVLDGRPAPQAVGVASMAETGAVVAADGTPLTELLRWDGDRGAVDTERLVADLGREALFVATGVRASAKTPLATWAWLRRTRPGVWAPGARWAGAADLVCLALTGRLVTDHTLAGRSMAYLLPPAGGALPGGFDPDLLAAVGLRPDHLPVVARPGETAGTVTPSGAVPGGLVAGTPVVVAGHDHAVAAWAAGTRAPGDRADSVGTAEAVLTVLDARASEGLERPAVAAQGMSLVRTVEGAHDALLAGSPSAGAMVEWWLATVLPGRDPRDVLRLAAQDPTGDPADGGRAGASDRGAGGPPGPTGVLVLPYPRGRQAPHPDPRAGVRVLDERDRDVTGRALAVVPGAGVPPRALRDVRAMLEGLALHARWLLDVQHGLARRGDHAPATGATGAVRLLAGAAAANAVWMAAKAALTPGALQAVTAAEPVATGAALLAAERTGLVPPGVLRLPVRTVAPASGPPGAWQHTLRRFVAAAHPTATAGATPGAPD